MSQPRVTQVAFVVALNAVPAACGCSSPAGSPAAPAGDPTEAIYDPTHIVEIALTMSPADWETLRLSKRDPNILVGPDCQAGPFPDPYEYFPASVTVDGAQLDSIGVRKKGFLGSLSPSKPSLKLDFDKFVPDQRISGLDKLTLNNAKQDSSLIRQCLAMKLYRDAGLPASRCNFAHVSLNGQNLGIYVNLEPVDDLLLHREFGDESGNLYEGSLSDLRPTWRNTYEQKNGSDMGDLDAVIAALQADDAGLLAALDPLVDIDEFTGFWALEHLVAHWDGYSNNENNHHIYHVPSTGKMVWLPWSPDLSFTSDDPFMPSDRPQSVSANAILPRRLYLAPGGKVKYVEKMRGLLDSVWKEQEIVEEIGRMEEMLKPHADDPAELAVSVDAVRSFVLGRRAEITPELDAGGADWGYALPGSPCSEVRGHQAGTFSTTFGTTGTMQNPFTTGTGTLELDIGGVLQTADPVGSGAGDDFSSGLGKRRQVLILGRYTGDQLYRATLLFVDPEFFVSGAGMEFDWQSAFGVTVQVDLANPDVSQVEGLFVNGSLHFDQAAAADGEPVSGSFEADLIR